MPIYEYQCEDADCANKHQEMISIHEYEKRGPLSECPLCRKASLERIYNGYGGFNLQGRDWPSKAFKGRR